jgi:hypothetical protein
VSTPTGADLASLADKIDGLDLTEAEHAILDAIFTRAAAHDDEVSGYLEIEQTTTYGGARRDAVNPTLDRLVRAVGPMFPGGWE